MTSRAPTGFDKRLGKRLRNARLLKGWSMEQLAAKLGIKWQQLQRHELGENRITAERLYLAGKELNMSLAYFLHTDVEETGLEELSRESLLLAGRIEALPDSVIRYNLSSLVASISTAWNRRENQP
ncbi:MAG: helix-turn-helix transcriptional regulator [Pseudomonadota bacterium]